MSQVLGMGNNFIPRAHAATYYARNGLSFCVDRFQARNMGQARAFAIRRAPKDMRAVTIDGPEDSIFFELEFSREAVDSSPTGLRAGAPGL
ncbi:hypothetical protein RHODOSMS8_00980 [Rhodobiaceae bacterium]|nr:hypothetical protein RHODOSMS8_00980 [Rhodobiaceae bacterium]